MVYRRVKGNFKQNLSQKDLTPLFLHFYGCQQEVSRENVKLPGLPAPCRRAVLAEPGGKAVLALLCHQPGQNIPTAARPIAPVAAHPNQRNGPAIANSPMIRSLLHMTMISAMLDTAASPFTTALQYRALIGSKWANVRPTPAEDGQRDDCVKLFCEIHL